MTKQQFIQYLEELGYQQNGPVHLVNGYGAFVHPKPGVTVDKKFFTQVIEQTNGSYFVRLSDKDFDNNAITGWLFNNIKND